jgi:hypothetical protein
MEAWLSLGRASLFLPLGRSAVYDLDQEDMTYENFMQNILRRCGVGTSCLFSVAGQKERAFLSIIYKKWKAS